MIEGVGLQIVNVRGADVPPPGAGLKTVTLADPTLAMSEAEICAVSCEPLTKFVGRLLPFQRTTELLTKPDPKMARVKPGPPLVAKLGLRLDSVGAGLLIARLSGLDSPPPGPGLKTVTLAAPGVAMSAAVIDAVSRCLLTKVVGRLLPLHRTTESLTKLKPVTVNVKAPPPAVTGFGLRLAGFGAGLLTGKLRGSEGPPPGAGLTTVMAIGPDSEISAAEICAVS